LGWVERERERDSCQAKKSSAVLLLTAFTKKKNEENRWQSIKVIKDFPPQMSITAGLLCSLSRKIQLSQRQRAFFALKANQPQIQGRQYIQPSAIEKKKFICV
jgi:hypothetical protein